MSCALNTSNSSFLCPQLPSDFGFGGGGFGGVNPFLNGNSYLGSNTVFNNNNSTSLDTLSTNLCPDDDCAPSSDCCPKDCSGCGRCKRNGCLNWLPITLAITQAGDWTSDGDKVPVKITFVNNLDYGVYVGMNDVLCGAVSLPGVLRAHSTYTLNNIVADTSLVAKPNQAWVRMLPYVVYKGPNDVRVQTVQSDSFAWKLCKAKPALTVSAFFMNTTNTTGTLIVGIDNNSKKTILVDALPLEISGNPTIFTDITPITTAPTLTPASLSTRFPAARYILMAQTAVGSSYMYDLVSSPGYLAPVSGANWMAFQVVGNGFTATTEQLTITFKGAINATESVKPNTT